MNPADLLDQFGQKTMRDLGRAYERRDRREIKRLEKKAHKLARKMTRATGLEVEFFAL